MTQTEKIEGYLQVGTNDRNEVVINLDHDRTGHLVFSPNQARNLAIVLLNKAKEADTAREIQGESHADGSFPGLEP